MDIEKQIAKLSHGAVQVLPVEELKNKLNKKKPLRIKLGADPTSPDLHLGHAVVLAKMRDFQDLGHEVIFLIGDYTARIGDPSGKSKTRPTLSKEDIKKNMQTYFEQVGKILDPKKTTVRYNSEWLDKLDSSDFLKLCGKITLAQITEREDFAKRMREQQPIGFHELMYPLLQAYDSVALQADVELGGTDQTFNLLLGRDLQQQFDQEPQVVITMPLLEGLDGTHKMSKSLGNAIGLAEPANEAFGKLMSISDELMWRYFELLLGVTKEDLSVLQERIAAGNLHPMALKKQMAHDIVAKFWTMQEADEARKQFEDVFQKRDHTAAQEVALSKDVSNPIWIVQLLKELNAIKTTSDGKRLIEQRAVSIDGEVVKDFKAEIVLKKGMVVKAGKHKIYNILI
ncbi:MAG: tyrosine--tRNA ligase [Candidatus Dependentiae bacterium]